MQVHLTVIPCVSLLAPDRVETCESNGVSEREIRRVLFRSDDP